MPVTVFECEKILGVFLIMTYLLKQIVIFDIWLKKARQLYNILLTAFNGVDNKKFYYPCIKYILDQ